MKSSLTVKSELQLNNRSKAEAEQHGFLHFLHSISPHDLIPSWASHWTYPHGSWSATWSGMIGCELNGEPWISCSILSRYGRVCYLCYLYFHVSSTVQVKPGSVPGSSICFRIWGQDFRGLHLQIWICSLKWNLQVNEEWSETLRAFAMLPTQYQVIGVYL